MSNDELQTGSTTCEQPRVDLGEILPENVLGGYIHQSYSQLNLPSSFFPGHPIPPLKQLIDGAPLNEHTSLVTEIFSNQKGVKMVNNLSQDDAQTFINIIGDPKVSLSPLGGWFLVKLLLLARCWIALKKNRFGQAAHRLYPGFVATMAWSQNH